MPYSTILVTGASGLLGSNIVKRGAEEGRKMRGLVRREEDAQILRSLGVEPAIGDLTDPESLRNAMRGCDGVIHAGAVIGGTWSTITEQEFEDVNYLGSGNVMDAAEAAGVERILIVSTEGILDRSQTITERTPLIDVGGWTGPYQKAKLGGYYDAMRRAVRGANLAIMCPGGIYGPSPFVERAIHPSQWNGAMLRGIRGELTRYAKYPFTWPFIEDSARIALGALDNDRVGARYLSVGRPEDSMSLAELINIACELAGSPHRVEDITPEQLEKEVGTMSVI
ncbi:MAG TPA: NAD-dependent epimerase/dehydratase family protein, partial [Novosphingobium sp.]